MESQCKSTKEILLEAATLLEEENRWGQRHLFRFTTETHCSMCAHGAIAYCGSSTVRDAVVARTRGIRDDGPLLAAIRIAHQVVLHGPDQDEGQIGSSFGPVGLAHYRALKSGLTFTFNDDPHRDKQDVIASLRHAASVL